MCPLNHDLFNGNYLSFQWFRGNLVSNAFDFTFEFKWIKPNEKIVTNYTTMIGGNIANMCNG